MDSLLTQALDDHTPKMNDKLVRGIIKKVFEGIPEYINQMINISILKINPNIDFKYKGYRICTPEEELLEDALSRASNKPADIAQNNVYLTVFEFEYNGQTFLKYIYLPYADPGNIFTISGTKYVVMPVITDLVISVKPDKIFIRLHRDKLHITSSRKRVVLNGNPNPELLKLVYSDILKSGAKDKMRPNSKTPLGLYLLCKYGLRETLRKYTNIDPNLIQIYYNEDENNTYIDPNTKEGAKIYKDYSVYSTVGERPKNLEKEAYRKHRICVLVHKDVMISPLIVNIVGAIIDSFDMYNGYIEQDYYRILEEQKVLSTKYNEISSKYPKDLPDAKKPKDLVDITKRYEDNIESEKMIYKILLGRGRYKSEISVDKIKDDLEEHVEALDSYVDEIIQRKLANIGIFLNDFWDMLAYIINIYADSVNNAKEYNRNINNIHIDIYYYICYYIIIGFNKAVKQINQRYEKNGKKPPSRDELKKIVNDCVSEKVIYNLVKSSTPSIALTQADISNDSLYYKATAMLENQNRGEGINQGGSTPFPDNIKTLTSHMFVYGSLLYLIKAAPTPSLRANPWGVWDDDTGHIIIPDHLKTTVDKLDATLRGITEAQFEHKEINDSMIEDIKNEEGDNDDADADAEHDNEPDNESEE